MPGEPKMPGSFEEMAEAMGDEGEDSKETILKAAGVEAPKTEDEEENNNDKGRKWFYKKGEK